MALPLGAGRSPHARVLTASSNSQRLTSWTGWPISYRRRGSTGIAITGCSPRITSSGPPSRRMTEGNVGIGNVGIGNVGKPRDAATHGHAFGGHAAGQDTTGDCCDSCDKPPSHDTSRRQRPNSWLGWGRSFLLRALGCGGDIRLIAVRLVYKCEIIRGLRTLGNLRLLRTSCPRSGADPEDPDTLRRTAGASAAFTCARPAHRLGRTRAGPLSSGQSFKRRAGLG